MIVDQYSPQIRRFVWTFVFQLLNQAPRQCDLPFTPIINSWLDEKSIDLMDIETYFTAFTQAQYANPNMFPNFPPIPTTFNIPGISGPTTSFRIPKSQFDLINGGSNQVSLQQLTTNQSQPTSPQSLSPQLQQQQLQSQLNYKPKQQQQQQQQSPQIPTLPINKLPTNTNNNTTPTKSNGQKNSVWSTELSSVFQQLALLQSWSYGLERIALSQKDMIWRTCRSFTGFVNYDSTSFIRTFGDWSNNPLPNLVHITVMFAAIGYLKEMGILKLDLHYPQSSVSVFSDNQQQQGQSQLMMGNGGQKKSLPRSTSNGSIYTDDDDEDQEEYDDEDDQDNYQSPPLIKVTPTQHQQQQSQHNRLKTNEDNFENESFSNVQSSSNSSPYISPRSHLAPQTLPNHHLLNSKKRKSTEDINDLAVAASLSDPSTPTSPYGSDDENSNSTSLVLPSLKFKNSLLNNNNTQHSEHSNTDDEIDSLNKLKKLKTKSHSNNVIILNNNNNINNNANNNNINNNNNITNISNDNSTNEKDSESNSTQEPSSPSKSSMNINSILCS
ncbi:hypothetical protein DLAC_02350 [Tieghemostelium lacteum]|uniref:Uncharacterized protein n=1 Tax=Tieghemostelium lacteum TaxID=361077 RepID=A0A152A571_TIELA|nr:hypothetical protein DLAC_02350 [Tieghemostelium lacteum]|eukprot:KYR01231.1 hypothetical protein DLAC_02350 [Tieghemostelium lacteum]